MLKPVKRFIAGAVCPECRQMDKLVMYRENDHTYRECVKCGFREEMLVTTSSQEVATRVSKEAPDERAQPVRIIDPSNS